MENNFNDKDFYWAKKLFVWQLSDFKIFKTDVTYIFKYTWGIDDILEGNLSYFADLTFY